MRAAIIFVLVILFISVFTTSFSFDVDGDGKEGLAEAIHALQIASGLVPTQPATGDAATSEVLIGKVFSNSSAVGITGTMPNYGSAAFTPGVTDQSIPEGYYDGSGTISGDADLMSSNIKEGVSIFGIEGTFDVSELWGCDVGTWDWMKCNDDCDRSTNNNIDCIQLCDMIENNMPFNSLCL